MPNHHHAFLPLVNVKKGLIRQGTFSKCANSISSAGGPELG